MNVTKQKAAKCSKTGAVYHFIKFFRQIVVRLHYLSL